jgi:hypothetical protein
MYKYDGLLAKLRLLDENGNLSITNIAMLVLLGKIVLANNVEWQNVAGLFLALAAYQHKKVLGAKADAQATVDNDQLKQLEAKVTELSTAFNFKKLI